MRANKTVIAVGHDDDHRHQLTIHDAGDVYDSQTGRTLTGAWLWDASLYLSHWLSSPPNPPVDLAGKSVLELGAGSTGLPGMTSALLGATRVVLTDVPALLPALLANIEVNGLSDGGRVEARELLWGSDESLSRLLAEFGSGFDVVLMSDVLYDVEETAKLAWTLKAVLAGREDGTAARVLAAAQVRTWTVECLNELVSQGLEVAELATGRLGVDDGGGGDVEGKGDDVEDGLFAIYSIRIQSVRNMTTLEENSKASN